MQLAERCFERGIPAIVSVHSINFHSSLRDFRGPALQALDEFLSALEAKHPNLLYVHDMNLYELVTRENSKVRGARFRLTSRIAMAGRRHMNLHPS